MLTDREQREMRKLIHQMSLADLTQVKAMLSKELDARHGKTKFDPLKWTPELTTR